MPRNPNKTRCYHPNCNNWAMRGQVFCRAHRDHELGPRGAGAPLNNLNALKTGFHAHPLPPPELDELAYQIIHHPDEFSLYLGLAIESIHRRTRDPLNRTLGLLRLVQQLVPLVSARLAKIELKNLLEKIPPHKHEHVLQIIKKRSAHLDSVKQLHLIRGIEKQLFPENAKKQLTEPEPGLLRETTGPYQP